MSRPTTRRAGRELALQILFQMDFNPQSLEETLALFWRGQTCGEAAKKFAETLARGATEKREELDRRIREHAEHWDLERMAAVDRNVLRLAAYEMFFMPDIPPVVSINEAVEIAKKFGGPDSGKFVNGILDKIMRSLSRPARTGTA